jgi:transketolase
LVAGTDFRKREPVVATGQAEADRRLDRLCIDTRTLAMDAVQKAKSGHPGTPMALAPVAYTLWQRVLRYYCADPNWPNRDRFVAQIAKWKKT